MGLIPFLAYRSDLPNRVASHYGISGKPDGSMTPEQCFIVIGGLMVLGLGGCVAAPGCSSPRLSTNEGSSDGRMPRSPLGR